MRYVFDYRKATGYVVRLPAPLAALWCSVGNHLFSTYLDYAHTQEGY